MALSTLTQLTQAQYAALSISPFFSPPGVSSNGNPDPRINIQLGGWVGTNVLAFTITDQASTDSSLTIDSRSTNTLTANVTNGGSPTPQTTYWTVNMGQSGSGSSWQISYAVTNGSTTTGTWIFVKGKATEEIKNVPVTKSKATATVNKAPVPQKAAPIAKKAPVTKKKAAPKAKKAVPKKASVTKKKTAPKAKKAAPKKASVTKKKTAPMAKKAAPKKASVTKKKAAPKAKKAAPKKASVTKKKTSPKKKKALVTKKKATPKKKR